MLLESLIVVLARGVLGVFLSGLLAVVTYPVLVTIVVSVWKVESVDYSLMGVVAIGFAAGLGGFLAWLDREAPRRLMALTLLVCLAGAFAGGWLGLQQDTGAFKLGGTLGIPGLRGIAVGAVLGGNLPTLLLGVAKAVMRPRAW